jgi:hypothetical protein
MKFGLFLIQILFGIVLIGFSESSKTRKSKYYRMGYHFRKKYFSVLKMFYISKVILNLGVVKKVNAGLIVIAVLVQAADGVIQTKVVLYMYHK